MAASKAAREEGPGITPDRTFQLVLPRLSYWKTVVQVVQGSRENFLDAFARYTHLKRRYANPGPTSAMSRPWMEVWRAARRNLQIQFEGGSMAGTSTASMGAAD